MKRRRNVQSQRNQIPAAFGRLCVETEAVATTGIEAIASRLRAAVC